MAQFTVTDVVNAGSRLPSGRQSSGIAQGAVFLALGRGVGQEFRQATFPLPTTDGLAGVNIQVFSGDQPYDAPMVYVAPNEVAAILPSAVPLGPATVKVTNNGVSASRAINVVAAAFGIFTGPLAQAAAFNVNGDGSFVPNGSTQTVSAGQDVLINGTGLGAIASDETQPGATDIPAVTVQVYVGVTPATVVSAGRGTCCDGIDPNFRIPQGVAGWDVVRFTVPDGISGCQIPVAVQVGTFISNVATIAVDPSGTACTPLRGILPPEYAEAVKGKTGFASAGIGMTRNTSITMRPTGQVNINKNDGGTAAVIYYKELPADASIAAYGAVVPNSCFIPPSNVPIVALSPPANLDAGPALTIKGPAGTRSIPKITIGNLSAYDQTVNLGNATPGNFLDPGHYTVTAPGGKDVGPFSPALDLPTTPFVWTNQPTAPPVIERSEGYTVKWSGGVPGTMVTFIGGTAPTNGNFTQATSFRCEVPVEAGEFTIPPFVLLTLAPTGTSGGVTFTGTLNIANTQTIPFKASGIDLGVFTSTTGYNLNPTNYK
jgi:uncharacterized protein (TIGR03437 family)